ncbi:MAG: metal-dependent hydrolase [Chloroflexi bacterium]|nr:metal-dependent hydrolase [Chloroflexota bacterium]
MVFFGHIGITLGVAIGVNQVLKRRRGCAVAVNGDHEDAGTFAKTPPMVTGTPWVVALGRVFDIRLLLVGAMLPDIIDKPVGLALFAQTLSNGRIFAHTLLFLVVVASVGFLTFRKTGNTGVLALALGTGAHLILDEMWLMPGTLAWPFLGFAFSKIEVSGWTSGVLHRLLTDPTVYVPEAVGFLFILWFLSVLARRGTVIRFLLHGRV